MGGDLSKGYTKLREYLPETSSAPPPETSTASSPEGSGADGVCTTDGTPSPSGCTTVGASPETSTTLSPDGCVAEPVGRTADTPETSSARGASTVHFGKVVCAIKPGGAVFAPTGVQGGGFHILKDVRIQRGRPAVEGWIPPTRKFVLELVYAYVESGCGSKLVEVVRACSGIPPGTNERGWGMSAGRAMYRTLRHIDSLDITGWGVDTVDLLKWGPIGTWAPEPYATAFKTFLDYLKALGVDEDEIAYIRPSNSFDVALQRVATYRQHTIYAATGVAFMSAFEYENIITEPLSAFGVGDKYPLSDCYEIGLWVYLLERFGYIKDPNFAMKHFID